MTISKDQNLQMDNGKSTTVSAAELKYAESAHSLEILCKEEELRKLRLQNMVLSHDLEELHEQLSEEARRGDEAEYDAGEWEARFTELNDKFERISNELRLKNRELDTLKTELSSLEHVSADSNKLLTEKLALTRELASLRPELDHLRSQTSTHENLLADKLALQRQLSATKIELEDERRGLQRATAKQSKANNQDAKQETQIEELKKELAKEKKEREKLEKTATKQNNDQAEDVRKQLANEKREREKAERQIVKAQAEWESQKAVLEDKLEQFRTKLRTTKEKLKETESELQQERDPATSVLAADGKAKNTRKRSAAQMDPDAAIGTPGDGAANKRSKRASSVVGEKSTFSITPFLNRTVSVAPESPAQDQPQQAHDADEPLPSIEDAGVSPSAGRAPAMSGAKKQPLATASAGKSNPKVRSGATRKKAAATITLEKVAEENTASTAASPAVAPNDENAIATAATAQVAARLDKLDKPVLKPKRSLSSFASFREGSLPPQHVQTGQKSRKRKLFGGGAKTLFDEDEEDDAEAGASGFGGAKLAAGGQRAFGAFTGRVIGGGLGALGVGRRKGPLTVAADGFQFSPLKKDRKAMAAAAVAGVAEK